MKTDKPEDYLKWEVRPRKKTQSITEKYSDISEAITVSFYKSKNTYPFIFIRFSNAFLEKHGFNPLKQRVLIRVNPEHKRQFFVDVTEDVSNSLKFHQNSSNVFFIKTHFWLDSDSLQPHEYKIRAVPFEVKPTGFLITLS